MYGAEIAWQKEDVAFSAEDDADESSNDIHFARKLCAWLNGSKNGAGFARESQTFMINVIHRLRDCPRIASMVGPGEGHICADTPPSK